MSCTDVQRKWNAGTRKNVGLRKAKHINFKRHRPGHTYPGPSSLPPDLTTSPQHFKNHAEFVSRITASTAKRVPKRPTTNPKKILNEHFYPAFKGNTATKYGKENEDNIIQLLKSRGHAVERRGLLIHPEHHWLAASPDGILDSTKLLEIKCPFKSSLSLTQFLNRPNGDIRSLGDG